MDTPTLPDELSARAAQCAKLADLFKSKPLAEIEPDELKAITPHYQQRISELRRKAQMRIVNVPRSMTRSDGTVAKQDGAYRYENFEKLGRDAGQPVPAPWNQDRPYAQEFRLTPPE